MQAAGLRTNILLWSVAEWLAYWLALDYKMMQNCSQHTVSLLNKKTILTFVIASSKYSLSEYFSLKFNIKLFWFMSDLRVFAFSWISLSSMQQSQISDICLNLALNWRSYTNKNSSLFLPTYYSRILKKYIILHFISSVSDQLAFMLSLQ